MSTSLLLPCSPPPLHRPSPADRTSLNRAPPLLHLGSFSPYNACQSANKTPLLKSRRQSNTQPVHIVKSPSGKCLPFSSSGSLALNDAPKSPLEVLPSQKSLLFTGDLVREPPLPSDSLSKEISLSRKPFLPPTKVAPKKLFSSESYTSLSPLSPLTPNTPSFPPSGNSPPSPLFVIPSRTLKKSQSTLIMPSLLTFLRPDPVTSSGRNRRNGESRLPRDVSSRSLNDPPFPPPLIHKCHTMIALSGSNSIGSPPHTTTTKVIKDKRTRFGFLRRISPSKSAVFSSHSSSFSLQGQIIRKSPSAAHALQKYRKTSGASMWPHPEHPEEEKDNVDSSPVGDSITENSSEGRIWNSTGGCSRCASAASLSSRRQSTVTTDAVFCKLCLTDVSIRELYQLQQCQCRFCTYCMRMYTTHKIREADSLIECPDVNCDCSGELTLEEIESLVGKDLLNLHLKFRRDREVDLDPLKTWCPNPGCETVVSLSVSKLDGRPQCSSCPVCSTFFCASCSNSWHPGEPCFKSSDTLQVPFNDAIKRCPRCKVPIERDAGCAQMQCKKCKHVFCWYCLTSLEDDFLLRHYDKGPCKNKLGHSRASVLWHRAQVVVIFAGFGLLLVIASPLLLFVGPCLLCRSCRPCSNKH